MDLSNHLEISLAMEDIEDIMDFKDHPDLDMAVHQDLVMEVVQDLVLEVHLVFVENHMADTHIDQDMVTGMDPTAAKKIQVNTIPEVTKTLNRQIHQNQYPRTNHSQLNQLFLPQLNMFQI